MLACGANAVPLSVPGAEAALSLRSFADAVILRIAARCSAGSATRSASLSQRYCPTTGFASSGRPDPHLAEAVGLDTEDGRIVVDEHMHTSARNVYAAGHTAAWDKVPGFSCTVGESTLKYCGWGGGHERSKRWSGCSASTPTTTAGWPTSWSGHTLRWRSSEP